jgi:hypothetical protein
MTNTLNVVFAVAQTNLPFGSSTAKETAKISLSLRYMWGEDLWHCQFEFKNATSLSFLVFDIIFKLKIPAP